MNKLLSAFRNFELPVVSPDDPHQLVGMLRREEVIAAYNRRLDEHKQPTDQSK